MQREDGNKRSGKWHQQHPDEIKAVERMSAMHEDGYEMRKTHAKHGEEHRKAPCPIAMNPCAQEHQERDSRGNDRNCYDTLNDGKKALPDCVHGNRVFTKREQRLTTPSSATAEARRTGCGKAAGGAGGGSS